MLATECRLLKIDQHVSSRSVPRPRTAHNRKWLKARVEVKTYGMIMSDNDLDEIIQICDPALDRTKVLRRIHEAIQRRQAAGGYGPNVTELGPKSLCPETWNVENINQTDVLFLHLQKTLDGLAFKSHLYEPKFRSNVPLVGLLIVSVRRFWNWMSTKWYVRGWMAQQMDFNTQAIELIGDLLRVLGSNEQRIRALELEVEKLLEEEDKAS